MSVIVVTGQPGSGKTALVVDMIAHDPQFEGRPLFVMGVPDLTIEHTACPPVEQWTEFRQAPEDDSLNLAYFTFPENALVVIDEAQRVYRPRTVGSKVPPEVAAFETHRHTGIDFILLTQHAGLIDSNIRKLVGRHIHIRVTPLGRYKYEWTELGDPDSSSSRELAAREKYKLPSRAFKLYKSSQLHTKIKTKVPWFVYMFGIAIVSVIALGWYAYQRVTARIEPASPGQHTAQSISQGNSAKSEHLSKAEYLAIREPRMEGLFYTAPIYDEITKPKDAPFPMTCVIVAAWGKNKEHCRCLDQQGNKYVAPEPVCRGIAENGMFKDWQEPSRPQEAGSMAAQPTAHRPSEAAQAPPAPATQAQPAMPTTTQPASS